jgi:hypothetical protein
LCQLNKLMRGIASRQENLKGYITALGKDDLPRSGLVLLTEVNRASIFDIRFFPLSKRTGEARGRYFPFQRHDLVVEGYFATSTKELFY